MAKPDGRLLRELRRRRGLTITALARRAGVAEKTVRLLEHDATETPHPDTIAAIAGALKVEPEALFATATSAPPTNAGAAPRPPAAAPSRPTWNAEALAPGTVERVRELGAARAALLADGRPVVVLLGPGGYGKSTLARALCHDAQVRERFTDGGMWVTLGEHGDTLGALTKLYVQLSGERPAFVDVEDAAHSVETLLRGRAVLLVVDDVWNAAHLRPLLRGAPACLVTTRDRDVAPADAVTIEVGAMDDAEASRVLFAGDTLAADSDGQVRQLAQRMGGFPLLLGLAAATLGRRLRERGDDLEDGLAHLEAVLDRYGVEGFDHQRPAERSQAVSSTLDASLSALAPDAQQRLAELSVFAEDAAVPLPIVAELWQRTAGSSALDAERLVARLHGLCLLSAEQGAHARLHDVIRAQLQARLGTRKREVTSQAADVLQARWSDGDAFALDQLPYQLAEAERSADLMALLCDFEWLVRKARERGWAAVLADFRLAPDERELETLVQALVLAAPYARDDPNALAQQLCGRLSSDDGEHIEGLLHAARAAATAATRTTTARQRRWLCPRTPSLSRPGGALLRVLRAHDAGTHAIDADREGKVVLTGGNDGMVRCWDGHSGEQLQAFRAHDGDIRCLSVSGDGRRVVTSAADGSPPRLWDVRTGALLREQQTGWSWARCRLDQDGSRLVTGVAEVTIWTTSGDVPPDTLPHLGGAMSALVLSHDGRWIATATHESALRLWDAQRGEPMAELSGHDAGVADVAFDRADARLASVSVDGTLRLWSVDGGDPLAVLRHAPGIELESVTWAAGDTQVVSGDDRGKLWVWQVDGGQLLGSLQAHEGPVSQLVRVGDGDQVASVATGEDARVWRLGRLASHPSPPSAVRAIADVGHGRIAVGRADGGVELWDVESARQLRGFAAGAEIAALLWVAAAQRLVAATDAGELLVFDVDAPAEGQPRRLGGHVGAALCLTDGGDGTVLSGGADRNVRRHRLAEGEELSAVGHHEGALTALVTVPHGFVGADSTGALIAVSRDGSRHASQRVPGRWVQAMAARGGEVLFSGDDGVLGSWQPWRDPAPRVVAHLDCPLSDLAPLGDDAWVGVDGLGRLSIWRAGEPPTTAFADERALSATRAVQGSRVIVAGGESGALHFLD